MVYPMIRITIIIIHFVSIIIIYHHHSEMIINPSEIIINPSDSVTIKTIITLHHYGR